MTETLILITLSTILTLHIWVTRRSITRLRRDIMLTTRGARQARIELLERAEYKDLDS